MTSLPMIFEMERWRDSSRTPCAHWYHKTPDFNGIKWTACNRTLYLTILRSTWDVYITIFVTFKFICTKNHKRSDPKKKKHNRKSQRQLNMDFQRPSENMCPPEGDRWLWTSLVHNLEREALQTLLQVCVLSFADPTHSNNMIHSV